MKSEKFGVCFKDKRGRCLRERDRGRASRQIDRETDRVGQKLFKAQINKIIQKQSCM